MGKEFVRDCGRGARGLCRWRGCSRSKIQTPNKSVVETKMKRERRNQKEIEKMLFDWGRHGGGKSIRGSFGEESI